jgi:hypothetical protein
MPRLRSSPPAGRTKHGTTRLPGLQTQLCTSRRPATCSFPAGSACTRGSDLPRGASWPFGSHPLMALNRRGAIGRALRPDRLISTVPPVRPLRAGPPRYCLQFGTAPAPWSADLAETFQYLLGADKLGVTAVALLSNSLAPATYASYDSALSQSFILCTEENIAPLQATPATMVCYTA